jgi:hypothetical protein
MSDRRDELREVLRRGDPAADGREPALGERRRRRAEVLVAAARAGSSRPMSHQMPWRALVVAFALLLLVSLPVVWRARVPETSTPPVREATVLPAPTSAMTISPSLPSRRQLQFRTPGGTRLVWQIRPAAGNPPRAGAGGMS